MTGVSYPFALPTLIARWPVSNRQLLIVGSFAVACCVILAVALNRQAAPPPPPKTDEAATIGRYQVVSVSHDDNPAHVVVLDTMTGVTWQVRLLAEAKDAPGWRFIGSPPQRVLPAVAVSAM
jgi:hypothetical protein